MSILRRMKNKKGFTLIELIVVLAILGVILAIAVPRYNGLQASAQVSADEATSELIIKSAELMQANEGYASPTATLAEMTGFSESAVNVTTNGVDSDITYLDAGSTPQSSGTAFTLSIDDGEFSVGQ